MVYNVYIHIIYVYYMLICLPSLLFEWRYTIPNNAIDILWWLWGKSKLAKIVNSGSLTPQFINNDVTAETIYSTTYTSWGIRLATGYFVLWGYTSSTHKVVALLLHHGLVCWVQPWEERITHEYCYGEVCAVMLCCVNLLLGPLCQPEKNKCVCSSYGSLNLLAASYFMPCLPWVQWTVQTVRYSETIVIMNSMKSNTVVYHQKEGQGSE